MGSTGYPSAWAEGAIASSWQAAAGRTDDAPERKAEEVAGVDADDQAAGDAEAVAPEMEPVRPRCL